MDFLTVPILGLAVWQWIAGGVAGLVFGAIWLLRQRRTG